jgi:5-methylcytosine-specific restriction endonuclease McrA
MCELTCCKCKEDKNTSEFHKNKSTKTGYAKQCKVCARASHKIYRDSTKGTSTKASYRGSDKGKEARNKAVNTYNSTDARKSNSSKYSSSPKGKSTAALNRHKRQASISRSDTVDLVALYEADGMKCHYCGIKLTHGHPQFKPTHDHIIPISQGGEHTEENIVAACKACNCSKRDMGYSEFVTRITSSRK